MPYLWCKTKQQQPTHLPISELAYHSGKRRYTAVQGYIGDKSAETIAGVRNADKIEFTMTDRVDPQDGEYAILMEDGNPFDIVIQSVKGTEPYTYTATVLKS